MYEISSFTLFSLLFQNNAWINFYTTSDRRTNRRFFRFVLFVKKQWSCLNHSNQKWYSLRQVIIEGSGGEVGSSFEAKGSRFADKLFIVHSYPCCKLQCTTWRAIWRAFARIFDSFLRLFHRGKIPPSCFAPVRSITRWMNPLVRKKRFNFLSRTNRPFNGHPRFLNWLS